MSNFFSTYLNASLFGIGFLLMAMNLVTIFIALQGQTRATQVLDIANMEEKILLFANKTNDYLNAVNSKRYLQPALKNSSFEDEEKQVNKKYSFFSFLKSNSSNSKPKTESALSTNMLSGTTSVSPTLPTFDANDTMYDYFLEWIHTLLEEMKGKEWVNTPPDKRYIGFCSDNLNLKHQGCGFFIPVCEMNIVSHTETIRTGWSCEMIIWSSCACSKPFTSVLKYIIPPVYECYPNVLHSYDLTSMLGLTIKHENNGAENHMILIPVGRCGLSAFFIFYIGVLLCMLILVFLFFLKYFRRLKYYFSLYILKKSNYEKIE